MNTRLLVPTTSGPDKAPLRPEPNPFLPRPKVEAVDVRFIAFLCARAGNHYARQIRSSSPNPSFDTHAARSMVPPWVTARQRSALPARQDPPRHRTPMTATGQQGLVVRDGSREPVAHQTSGELPCSGR